MKEAAAVVLTPSVGPDHAREPEQRAGARDERGADDRPFAAPRHERARYDTDALEEEDHSREQRDDGDDAHGEPHGYFASRTESALFTVAFECADYHFTCPCTPT